jgi:hypothetical protein
MALSVNLKQIKQNIMQSKRKAGNFIFVALGFVLMLSLFIYAANPFNTEWKKEVKKNYNIYSMPFPEQLDFAGSIIPLQDEELKERYDRELLTNMYWQSQTLLFIKRANKIFPEIAPILKTYDVPDDFKYLSVAESGLQAHAVSSAGAAGYWQFLDKTGKVFGLIINEEVDERYHLQKSTEAACRYFKKAYEIFGDWSLVAASYNMGIEGVKRQLASQQENNYYDLYLNQETSRYLLRIVSIKTILQQPDEYGFHVAENHHYQKQEIVFIKVQQPVKDLYAFAKQYGCTYKELKYLNPWLRKPTLLSPGSWTIELPKRKIAQRMPINSDTIIHIEPIE